MSVNSSTVTCEVCVVVRVCWFWCVCWDLMCVCVCVCVCVEGYVCGYAGVRTVEIPNLWIF